MQVTETLSDGLKRGYSVVVPAADIESRRSKRLAELGHTARLPGFRPGKVPASVVKQRFGASVTAEVLEQSVREATEQVLTGRGLRVATQPRIELVSIDPAHDLQFKVELELFPDIALPDFSAIEITRRVAVPGEAEIASTLASIAARQRVLEPVEEPRPAEKGDFLTIDFVGKVDDTPFPDGTGSDVDVEVAGPGFVPGFTGQLLGLAPGRSRSFRVTFPSSYRVASLAGRAATFEVTAKGLKRAVVPAIDDALASKLGFESLDDLTAAVKRSLQSELDRLAWPHTKRLLLDALAAGATFEVPQGLVEPEFTQIWQRLEADRKQGRVDAEDAGKDDDTLRAEYRAIAERRVRLALLLGEISRANGIAVAQGELDRAIQAEASRHPGQEQKIIELFGKNPGAVDRLRGAVLEEKAVDFVLQQVRVTDATVTAEELAGDAGASLVPAQAEEAGQVEAAADEGPAVAATGSPGGQG